MTAYHLRVEGVNLDYFVTDTEDLSTVRGGGLLLLDAPGEVERLLRLFGVTFARVTSGASQAVFRFDAASPAGAEAVRRRVEDGLREVVAGGAALEQLGHATFVLDVCPVDGDFRRSQEALLAKNRWRQMGQCRLAPPDWNTAPDGPGRPYCGVDLVRPATTRNPVRNEDQQRVSVSVAAYGRDRKQQFYDDRARGAAPPGARFARHFHEIGPRPGHRLDGKMAVVYADGNRFGRLQQRHVTDEASQARWDRHVQGSARRPPTCRPTATHTSAPRPGRRTGSSPDSWPRLGRTPHTPRTGPRSSGSATRPRRRPPVHYPQIAGPAEGTPLFERERFRWFVANDKSARPHWLRPVNDGDDLPRLDRQP